MKSSPSCFCKSFEMRFRAKNLKLGEKNSKGHLSTDFQPFTEIEISKKQSYFPWSIKNIVFTEWHAITGNKKK